MKCRAYFYQEGEQKDIDLDKRNSFKPKSNWIPKVTNPVLDLFLGRLEEEVLSVKEQGRNYSNLSREEIKALRDLKNYRDVVIKPADKGSAVVIWALKEYREEAYAQLGESEVYEKVDNNPVKDLNEKVITKLKDLKDKGVISDENYAYFKPEMITSQLTYTAEVN